MLYIPTKIQTDLMKTIIKIIYVKTNIYAVNLSKTLKINYFSFRIMVLSIRLNMNKRIPLDILAINQNYLFFTRSTVILQLRKNLS